MKNTLLALLLALSGQSAAPVPDAGLNTPSAPVTEQRQLLPAMLVGAWRGTRISRGVIEPVPLEVTFADDVRPATVVAHFTMGDGPEAATLRRLASLVADQVVFALVDGGKMSLHLDETGRKLLGSVTDLTDRSATSTVELTRLRDALTAPSPLPSQSPSLLGRPGPR